MYTYWLVFFSCGLSALQTKLSQEARQTELQTSQLASYPGALYEANQSTHLYLGVVDNARV